MAHGNRRRGRAARSRTNGSRNTKLGSQSRDFAQPLWLEQLEDRRMLAVFNVSTLADIEFIDNEWVTAAGSLRAAIEAASENDEFDSIYFNSSLSGTISLQVRGDDFGQLTIDDSLEIVGTGTRKITIAGAANRRVFEVTAEGEDPISVSISGLTITGGTAFGDDEEGLGGGILNNENLTLTEIDLSNNRATSGGGIFNAGNLTIERSLIRNNTASTNGGGIKNGEPEGDGGGTTEGPPPETFITSSTITGNSANTFNGYGGGLFNGNGTVLVQHCTIVDNNAYLGSGIGSWGNPVAEEPAEGEDPMDPPPPVVFTTVEGSILFRNFNRNDTGMIQLNMMERDIDVVGKGEDDDEGNATDLGPSINIDNNGVPGMAGGNNLIWGRGLQVEESPGDVAQFTDPNFFDEDVMFGQDMTNVPTLENFGGSTDGFHIDPEAFFEGMAPTVNHHGGGGLGPYDQRGRHFVRTAKVDPSEANPPLVDLGAIEMQVGEFRVDILADETDDLQYSGDFGVETVGDFSIREALLFSELNPLVDTVTFSIGGQVDPTPSSAPTLLLTNGQILVNHSVNIVGPSSFIMEIDGNDPSTVFADGTRIFNVTDGDDMLASDVSIRNLTLIGADTSGSGGAILNRENLTIEGVTLNNNRSSLDGSAIHHDRGALTILDSTISGNNASDDGAVYIAFNSGSVLISGATISGNTSGDRGAGLFNRGMETRVEFSTITNNNSGSTIGSGIMSWSGELTVYSTIISGNFLNDFAANSATSPVSTSEGFNLVGTVNAAASGTFTGSDIFSTTPNLAPLAFSGGLTQTHALLVGSLAIDAGDDTPTNAPNYDQRGNPFVRIADGDDDTVARIDIGAYELQGLTFIVDTAGDGSDGVYTTGNLTLREAIELANGSPKLDTILFDDVALGDNPTINPSGALAITDNVQIIWMGPTPLTLGGSGAVFNINNGNANTFIDVSIDGGDPGVNPLTFSGRNIVNIENLSLSDVVMLGNNTSAITHQLGMLDIRTSQLTGNISSVSGGAINAQNAAGVYIYDSTFTGNSTAFTGGHGGAIYLKNTPFEANQIVLANNLTAAGASDGAGIYIDNSGITSLEPEANDVRFENSVISGNRTIGANSDGAGIFAKAADVILSNETTVALNATFGTNSKGGAIYLNGGGTLTISDNVTFTFNRTLGQFSSGGAIASVGGTVNITATNIDNNTTQGADAHGGAIYIQDGALSVTDSTFFENRTNGLRSDGGAIFSNTNLTDKQTLILNSTISGNTAADRGGGIYNADGLTVIKHSTITNNAAPYFGFGAGVASFGNSTTTKTQVGNSIIAGNVVHPDYADIPGNTPSDVDRINGAFQDSFQSLGYNLIGFGVTGAFTVQSHDFFNIADPGLEKFEAHGGQTLTWSLKEGSLAIDGGNPAAVAGQNGVPLKDQRGKDRIFNAGSGGSLDIGAFESSFTAGLPGDYNGDGVVNGRDFLAWQRGNSPSPLSSSDLATWRANYGAESPLVATVVTTEVIDEPSSLELISEEAPASTVAVPAETTTVAAHSENDQASNAIFFGWGAFPSAARAERAQLESSSTEPADEYLAAYEGEFADLTLTAADRDFGDIATRRSVDADESDDLSAEDAVFELIGGGAF